MKPEQSSHENSLSLSISLSFSLSLSPSQDPCRSPTVREQCYWNLGWLFTFTTCVLTPAIAMGTPPTMQVLYVNQSDTWKQKLLTNPILRQIRTQFYVGSEPKTRFKNIRYDASQIKKITDRNS